MHPIFILKAIHMPLQKLLVPRVGIAMLGIVGLADVANAATATTTFQVQMQITASCIINSAGNLIFPSTGVIAANVDATSTLSVQCTNTTPYNISLDAGAGSGATTAARKMTSGGNTITYSLYSDSGRTTLWGDVIGTNTVASAGTGAAQIFTIYGRVPPQTTPAPATYTDTINVTVTY